MQLMIHGPRQVTLVTVKRSGQVTLRVREARCLEPSPFRAPHTLKPCYIIPRIIQQDNHKQDSLLEAVRMSHHVLWYVFGITPSLD
jgi:hypothetical protein